MKLRNKKTGEVIILIDHIFDKYNSFAEVSAEWEDYEEPKDFWYIDCFRVLEGSKANFYDCELSLFTEEDIEKLKLIGNYFETKEEAEKAVEKLKALKRLKDKGFKFEGFEETDRGELGDFTIYTHIEPDYSQKYDELDDDLYLLFGGEE